MEVNQILVRISAHPLIICVVFGNCKYINSLYPEDLLWRQNAMLNIKFNDHGFVISSLLTL